MEATKANALLNLIKVEVDGYSIIDQIYLYVRDPNKAKYQCIIKKHKKKNGHENLKNLIAFIENSNKLQDVSKNIDDYNPNRKYNVLIVFNDMISNKKHNQIVTELFIIRRKLNISIVFMTQSYFKVPKYFRLNSALIRYWI